MPATKRTLALFDVDGTLTPARLKITPEMKAFLAELRKTICIGVVGGSDFVKQQEQIGEDSLSNFDYSFAENGLVAYKDDQLIAKASFAQKIGEDELQKLIRGPRLPVQNSPTYKRGHVHRVPDRHARHLIRAELLRAKRI